MTAEEYGKYIRGKKAAVLGVGVSNLPLIEFLTKCGANVTARDKKQVSEDIRRRVEESGAALICGEGYLDNIDADIIFKTPGMRPDVPQLEEAGKRGSTVTSEMELFFELCPCEIFAVTGSDGKTTTTTLVCEMLKKAGYTCHLGGNIGKPLIGEIGNIKPEDKAVVELSSFQLFTMRKSAHTAVVTNLAPNHLDWHKDLKEYEDAKKNIYRFQSENDRLVLNLKNEKTRNMRGEAKGELLCFGEKAENAVYAENGAVYVNYNGKTEEIMRLSDIILPGAHNAENYMAAAAAVWGYVPAADIREVAKTFGGVPHRIELVREKDGVKYYNDSIASSPTRTMAALNAFNEKLILIAGGYDKKIPFEPIGKLVNEKVKILVLVGDTAEKIKAAVEAAGSETEIIVKNGFEEAVRTAAKAAKPGDTVILSPMCASFDLFKNFEERGNRFKEIVNSL